MQENTPYSRFQERLRQKCDEIPPKQRQRLVFTLLILGILMCIWLAAKPFILTPSKNATSVTQPIPNLQTEEAWDETTNSIDISDREKISEIENETTVENE